MLKQQYAAKVLETITKMVRHLLYRFDMTSFSPSSMFQQTLQLLVMQGSYGSWKTSKVIEFKYFSFQACWS